MPPLIRPLRMFAFALAIALAAPAAAPADTVMTEAGDPAMSAAVETARSHLDQVLSAGIDETGVGHPALTLKVSFPVETADGGAGSEVIWLSDISLAQSGMAGKLANDPLYMDGLAAGDEVRFSEDMIADWGLVGPSGRIFGHYTTRILLETMPEEQAAPIREVLTDDPLPEAWQ